MATEPILHILLLSTQKFLRRRDVYPFRGSVEKSARCSRCSSSKMEAYKSNSASNGSSEETTGDRVVESSGIRVTGRRRDRGVGAVGSVHDNVSLLHLRASGLRYLYPLVAFWAAAEATRAETTRATMLNCIVKFFCVL